MATPPVFTAGSVLTAAQMNAAGLWVVTPSAVSGTGVTLSGSTVVLTASPEPYITCFSADYLYYRIIANFTAHGGAAQSVTFRMANGTTPNTTAANYVYTLAEQSYATGAFVTASGNGTAAQFACGRVESNYGMFTMDILNPFATARTSYISNYVDAGTVGRDGGSLTVTTSYNAINIRLNGTNTLTGTVDIYGYN